MVDGAIRHPGFAPRKGALGAVARDVAGAVGGAVAPRRDPGAQRHPGHRARTARPGRRGPCGTMLLTAPDMVPVPASYRRRDGLSLWRRHGAEVYTTRAQLDTEARLLCAAAQTGAPSLAPDRAARALGADRARLEARLWREHGRHGAPRADPALDGAGAPLSRAGLSRDQAHAAYGILTSRPALHL